jgi:hypothetical protein
MQAFQFDTARMGFYKDRRDFASKDELLDGIPSHNISNMQIDNLIDNIEDGTVKLSKQSFKGSPKRNRSEVSIRREEFWQSMFEELVDYKKKHGHCNVLKSKKEGKLGIWVSNQRRSFRSHTLSADRVRQLNEIGFEWKSVEQKKKDKQIRCEKSATEVSYESVDSEVETEDETEDYFAEEFGRYLVEQNFLRHSSNGFEVVADNQDYMDEEDYEFTDSIDDRPRKKRNLSKMGSEDRWMKRYEELKEFKQTYGHLDVHYLHHSKELYNWMYKCRAARKSGTLHEERIKLLEELDFDWSLKRY